MSVKIEVMRERCMGAGNCAEVSPDYFDQDSIDGTVVLLRSDVEPGDEHEVETAADVCPVAAILVKKTAASV
ncbi:MAG: ferredoxin [Subtercola sp.]|nr:ferredoxin [Subtercola sp.]